MRKEKCRYNYENTIGGSHFYHMENIDEIKKMITEIKAAIVKYDRSLGMGFENYRDHQEFQKVCNAYSVSRLIRYLEEALNEINN